jgi:hypothetical protein
MIYINSVGGRIGSFWWVNAETSPIVLIDATYKGSHHLVWRQGASGWGVPSTFKWLSIK